MSAAVLNVASVSDSPAPGDAELVERFVVARDHAAFAELVHRHSHVVHGVCRRVLYDADDIDDVFQATFLVFVRDAARVRRRTSLASWLYGVAYRLSLRVARQKRRRRETILVDDALIDDDTFKRMADRHDQQLIDSELNGLPERYRQPLVLRYLAGKSPSEVASELGISIGTVDGLLKRGKDELRRRLLQRGITLGTALIAVQVTQQAAQAAGTETLIEATIQASLAWDFGSNTLSPDLVTDRAVELAGKEVIAMTTATKSAIAIGLTLGGIVVGLGGANIVNGRQGGSAEAAGIVTTMSVTRAANDGVEFAAVAADPNAQEDNARSGLTENSTVTGENNPQPISTPLVKWDFKSRSPIVARIEKALSDITEVSFTDQPLKDALGYLEDRHHIRIWIDAPTLSDEGISPDQLVNGMMSGTSLKSTLRLILEPLLLDYIVQNDVMVITTRAKADENFETRVYNTGRIPNLTPKELSEIITATVEPDRWSVSEPSRPNAATNGFEPLKLGIGGSSGNQPTAMPGAAAIPSTPPSGVIGQQFAGGGGGVSTTLGSIRSTTNALIIRQTQRMHEEIVELLNQLEQQQEQAAKAAKPREILDRDAVKVNTGR